jgi:hypothetical protein
MRHYKVKADLIQLIIWLVAITNYDLDLRMNCHPLIILIILNFKREPTSKSSLEIDSLTKLSLEHPIGEEVSFYWKTTQFISPRLKKLLDIHSIMRS